MLQARQEIEKLPGVQNAFLCVIYQILKCFKSCCGASDLILSVGAYEIKRCVAFLTRQGSLHPDLQDCCVRMTSEHVTGDFFPSPGGCERCGEVSAEFPPLCPRTLLVKL